MKTGNFISKEDDYRKSYPAIVKNNNDPQMLGRLQVQIPPLAGENLIWVQPRFLNGGVTIFAIPDINDVVEVIFESDDLQTGKWSNSETPTALNEAFKSDYPLTYGLADKEGNFIIINRKEKLISINSLNNINVNAENDINVTAKNINAEAKEEINAKAVTINAEASDTVNIKAVTVNIDAATTNVLGDFNAVGTCVFEGVPWITHNHPYTWARDAGSGDTGGVNH